MTQDSFHAAGQMSEWKPCPFCGGSDIRWDRHVGAGRGMYHHGWDVYSMCCRNCGGTVPNRYSLELVNESWNRRAALLSGAKQASLSAINEAAKVYASSYASPHHITFTVEGLRNFLAALQHGGEAPVAEGFFTPDGRCVQASHSIGYLGMCEKDRTSGCTIRPLYATPPKADAPVLPQGEGSGSEWIALTDEDRDRAFNTLPDMLDGFMKKWGWLHFAKAIEAECRRKNERGIPVGTAGGEGL